MRVPVALSIAGSDSGAGAGIQADLKTFHALGVFGTTAITAVTAQSTTGVSSIQMLDESILEAQIHEVMLDFNPTGVKTGMLGTASMVRLVASLVTKYTFSLLVVDPVFASTTGDVLTEDAGVAVYKTSLIPKAFLLTPNHHEAALLIDEDPSAIHSIDTMVEAGKELLQLGSHYVLVKGGGIDELPTSPDVLVWEEGFETFCTPRIETRNDHGTGCTLSAAILSFLIHDYPPVEAVRHAKGFVTKALQVAVDLELGHGHGPLLHGIDSIVSFGARDSHNTSGIISP